MPETLRRLPRWIRWRLTANEQGKLTKLPQGSTSDPENFHALDDLLGVPVDGNGGLGFVLTDGVQTPEGSRIVCLDLDGCRDPRTGALASWATDVVQNLGNSYTEVTPSGAGLHVWLAVREFPEGRLDRTRRKLEGTGYEPPGGGTGKSVELQVFGHGPAQYVTMTGQHLPGTSAEIETIPDLRWLQQRHHLARPTSATEVPVEGLGDAPSRAQIAATLARDPEAAALAAGDWQPSVAGKADPSPSAAFGVLVGHVLRATQGHVDAAVDYLLNCTAFGRGEIADSREPDKFGRESWVRADVARALQGTPLGPVAAQLFEVAPPDPRASTDGLLVQLDDYLKNTAPTSFLIDGFLPATGVGQIFGDPGGGKTPFAMSIGLHVAASELTHWCGREIDAHGTVVYMVGEDAHGVAGRLTAETKALKLHPASVPFYATSRPGKLTDPTDVRTWIEAIEAATGDEPVRMLIVDTQIRNFGPGDENSTEDMGRLYNHLQDIADRLGCFVLTVHHSGRKEKERSRGSNVSDGACDAIWRCQRDPKDRLRTRLISTKAKNWSQPPAVCAELIPEQIGTDHKGRPVTAVRLRHDVDAQTHGAVDQFDSIDPADVQLDDEMRRVIETVWNRQELEPVSERKLAGDTGLSRKVVKKRLGDAMAVGWIERTRNDGGRGGGFFYSVTDEGLDALEAVQQTGDDPDELL